MHIDKSLPNNEITPVLLVAYKGDKFYYLGDCITGFDNSGESLMEGLPYKDVNMLANADEEDFEEILLGDVAFNEYTANYFTSFKAEIVPLIDPNYENVLVLYDAENDIHHFFQC